MICISKVISQMHSLDIIEHVQLVCSDRVDQLNSVLRTFHQNCRHYTLIYPLNKFKDMNLPMRPTDKLYESLFDYKEWVKYNVLADLGFGLEIKQTSLKTPEIHAGVYLRVKDGGSLPIMTQPRHLAEKLSQCLIAFTIEYDNDWRCSSQLSRIG